MVVRKAPTKQGGVSSVHEKQINVRMKQEQLEELHELERRLGECRAVVLRLAVKHMLATLPAGQAQKP